MKRRQGYALHSRDFLNQTEQEFMNAPNVPLLTSYRADLQTQEYRPLRASDEAVLNPFAVADLGFFWPDDAIQQLQEVRQEVEEALELDNEIAPVPETAYDDAYWLLKLLFVFNRNIPMPDIGWLMDGGIGFEWRSIDGKGIATMSIYGNNQVVYGASLGNRRRVKGTCALSDSTSLGRFLTRLAILCDQ